jgi:lipopolysaccharide transport system ATP-binding protein
VSSDTHLDKNYQWIELALVFTVINMSRQHFIGCAWIDPGIEIEFLSGAT